MPTHITNRAREPNFVLSLSSATHEEFPLEAIPIG